MLDWQEKLFNAGPAVVAAAIAVAVLATSLASHVPTARPVVPAPPTSDTMTLLVVETSSCGWCKRFRKDVAPGYPDSGYARRAPIRYLDYNAVAGSGYRLGGDIRGVPTFILVDREGVEIDRYRGYPGGPERFYPAIDNLLDAAASGRRAGTRN